MEGTGPRLSDEGHKVYRVRQTCMKMLEKRGYNVLQEHVSMSSEAFMKEFGADPQRHNLTLLVEKVSNEGVCGILRVVHTRVRGTDRRRLIDSTISSRQCRFSSSHTICLPF